MSRHKTIGFADFAVKMIDNWIAAAHSGASVVPVDFYRECDRFERRDPPNMLWAKAVDAIYTELLSEDEAAARCVVALTFGAPRDRLRRLGVTREQGDMWLWLFGYEVSLIDLRKVCDDEKLAASPRVSYTISKEFGDLRKPLARERIAANSSVWAGGKQVRKLFE